MHSHAQLAVQHVSYSFQRRESCRTCHDVPMHRGPSACALLQLAGLLVVAARHTAVTEGTGAGGSQTSAATVWHDVHYESRDQQRRGRPQPSTHNEESCNRSIFLLDQLLGDARTLGAPEVGFGNDLGITAAGAGLQIQRVQLVPGGHLYRWVPTILRLLRLGPASVHSIGPADPSR